MMGTDIISGGSLWPVFVALVVLAFHLLEGYVDLLGKRGKSSHEHNQLRQEIKGLLKEASSLSTPSTFAQAAKLRRMAAAKEKELVKKQEELFKESKLSLDLYKRILMGLKVTLYAVFCWKFWGVPLAVVPHHLLQPLGRLLSWKSGDAVAGFTSVGMIPWLVLTSRVGKFLVKKKLSTK